MLQTPRSPNSGLTAFGAASIACHAELILALPADREVGKFVFYRLSHPGIESLWTQKVKISACTLASTCHCGGGIASEGVRQGGAGLVWVESGQPYSSRGVEVPTSVPVRATETQSNAYCSASISQPPLQGATMAHLPWSLPFRPRKRWRSDPRRWPLRRRSSCTSSRETQTVPQVPIGKTAWQEWNFTRKVKSRFLLEGTSAKDPGSV